MLAVARSAVGILVAVGAVGKVPQADAVAVGLGVAINIRGAALLAIGGGLIGGSRTEDRQEGTAVIGLGLSGTGGIIVDHQGGADEILALGINPHSLAGDSRVAGGGCAVERGAVGPLQAAVALVATQALGTVLAGAVGILIALGTILHVLDAASVAVGPGVALFVLDARLGTLGRDLLGFPGAQQVLIPVAQVRGHCGGAIRIVVHHL